MVENTLENMERLGETVQLLKVVWAKVHRGGCGLGILHLGFVNKWDKKRDCLVSGRYTKVLLTSRLDGLNPE